MAKADEPAETGAEELFAGPSQFFDWVTGDEQFVIRTVKLDDIRYQLFF